MRLSLTPSTDLSDYPFTHTLRSRFADTDAMGVVHHAAYLPYLEEARVELLRHTGRPYDGVRSTGVELVVLEVFVQYRRALHFDDVVTIGITTGAFTGTTFQVAYLLQVTGEVRATAVTVHGATDAGGRPRRLPGWLTASQFIPS